MMHFIAKKLIARNQNRVLNRSTLGAENVFKNAREVGNLAGGPAPPIAPANLHPGFRYTKVHRACRSCLSQQGY